MTPDAEPLGLVDIAKWLASALGALALWVAALFKKRLEAAEMSHAQLVEQVRELELNSVSRDTYHRHENDVHQQLTDMQKKAEGREDRILTAIGDLGKRVDALFQRADR